MADYPVFTIDKDDGAPMRAFRFAKDLYERIIEAQNLAFMNEIKANTVVINGHKYGMLKDKPGFVPTVFGMKAETKADIPDEWDFFLQERPPQPKTKNEIYPLTITLDRYTGSYSGGKWTAWNCEPGEIPEGPFEDDVGCAYFWADNRTPVGIGESPEAAIADLVRKIEEANE